MVKQASSGVQMPHQKSRPCDSRNFLRRPQSVNVARYAQWTVRPNCPKSASQKNYTFCVQEQTPSGHNGRIRKVSETTLHSRIEGEKAAIA